jgi:hypothetical protein
VATFVIVRTRTTSGVEARADEVLLWQAASYGLWIPVALAASLIFTRSAPGKRAAILIALVGVVAVFGHAVGASALEEIFTLKPRGAVLAGAADRLPIDLLVYTAICAAAWGLNGQRRSQDLSAALAAARTAISSAPPVRTNEEQTRILVSTGTRNHSVEAVAIEWIGAAANYAVIHWEGGEGLVRETLKALEQRLNPDVFVRIHRSSIVNLAMVESAASLSDGSWRLVTKSGDELVVSRTYRDQILARLGRRAP